MKIYTKTGDSGETALVGGKRVQKDAIRVDAYGEVDETNAAIGVALSQCSEPRLKAWLSDIQQKLFVLGAELATPGETKARSTKLEENDVQKLEEIIDTVEDELAPLKAFILPGGSPAAASLHLARTISRRAERRVVTLAREDEVSEIALRWLNRLSDLLFVLARRANMDNNESETEWRG